MPSAQVTITQLPAAGAITGTEAVPIVQNGQTVQTTTGAIAASPAQTQTFVTVNQEPTLTNSRALSGGTGIGITDGGAQSTLQLTLNGASGSLESALNGIIAKTGGATVTARTLQASGAGLTVSDGNGVSGNPTYALSGLAASLANLSGTGVLGINGGTSITSFVITGTTNEINVANGAGPGNPTISIATNPVIPGTGAMKLPLGTTGERPGGSNGQIRYNTTSNRYEGYQNGTWSTLGNGDGTVTSVSGTANQISVANGTTTPVVSIANDPILPGNSSVTVPIGTTGDRAISPVNGMFRYNSQTGTFEGYANNVWGAITTGSGVTSVDVSGGTTGLTTSGGPITSSGTITFAGTLITANGGTGLASYTAGDMVYYATGTALSKLTIGSNGQVLTSTGSAPQWSNQSSLSVGSATAATNLAGGAAGSIPYQSGAGTTTFLASGTGVLVNNGGNPSYSLTPSGLTSVTVTQAPTSALQLATKQYVDDAVSTGITIHTPVRVETPTALNATYLAGGTSVTVTDITGGTTLTFSTSPSLSVNDQVVFSSTSNGIVAGTAYYVYSVPAANQVTLSLSYDGPQITTFTNGTGLTIGGLVNSGVGATLTNAGANAAIQIDGVNLSSTNRVLVYNQANAAHNGVYTVTTVGDGSTPWVLTRATTENTYKPDSISGLGQGDYFFVQEGLTGAGESYVMTTSNPIIIGTTNLTFTQFSASQVYSAGTGLTLTGTTFSLTSPVTTSLGGTGLTSYTAGDIVYYAAGTAFTKLGIGASTTIMTSTGSAPQWSAASGITIGTATNIAGGAAGSVPYNTASGTTTFLGIGSSTFLLTSTGTAPQWSDPSGVTVGTATNAVNSGITLTSTNATFYPSFVANTSGNEPIRVASGLTFNPSTNTLTTTTFSGALSGNATTATTATNANNIAIAASGTNASFYPTFVNATTGNLAVTVDSDLTYNPSTNTLTAGTMVATTGIFGGTF
jgi:hypothetical protein